MLLLGPGEGPSLVAEEHALDECLWNRRAVDCDKASAIGVTMNHSSSELFARASLAFD
jgi:hypothetical protein